MTEEKLLVTVSPHIRAPEEIPRIMWNVLGALTPALAASYLFFGWRALAVVAVTGGAAVATEWVIQKLCGMPITVNDGSALVAGVLLAMCLSPAVPFYIAALGGVFAIAIAKQAFGGLGCNIWNPAHAARAFLLASFPTHIVMPKWPILSNLASGNVAGADAITMPTSLEVLKKGGEYSYKLWELAVGQVPGCLGETSAIALLAGGLYLIYRGYIDWRLPVSYLAATAVFVFVFPGKNGGGFFQGPVLVHLLSGGLMIGAFFMATDMVTSPITSRGQVIFGLGCGILTGAIRLYGGYPEGVCYSILIMNTFVPLIDRWTVPRKFGG